jgi:hypothetical protein
MIRQGNNAREAECVFNLLPFQLNCLSWRDGRCPIRAVKIHRNQRDTALAIQSPFQQVKFFREFGNELESFFGTIRVTVE